MSAKIARTLLSSLALGAAATSITFAAPLPAPTGLMCDLLARPALAPIVNARPRFSWIVNSDVRNDVQSAYEIRVAPEAAVLGESKRCLWDSGKVASDKSIAVGYRGSALLSHQSFWWRVRIWNRDGRLSAWSEAQEFRTGDIRSETAQRVGDDRLTISTYPRVVTAVRPARVEHRQDGSYFFDFGKDAFAGLDLSFDGAMAGASVTVRMGEKLDAGGRIDRNPGGSRRFYETKLAVDVGSRVYRVALPKRDERRMPSELGGAMPFRYVEIENSPCVLSEDSAVQQMVHYPFEDDAASFSCSDPKLNEIWKLCHYSMKATSFAGVFVDGDRERKPYEADAYINGLGWYAANREYSLARYSTEDLILHATWPTEWQIFSVMNARADYMATGDNRSLAAFYDDLNVKTLAELARPDGLISTVGAPKSLIARLHVDRIEDIVDWPAAERDGYEMKPVNAVVNAFHYRALLDMAEIAAALGKTQDAEADREKAKKVYEAFNRVFFNPATGLYVDGEGSTHSSQHANMFAIAFGLVPADRLKTVADFTAGRGMACSVYGAQFLMDALFDAGMSDKAIALMTAPGDRSWRHMAEDVGTTITLEAWDDKYKPNEDWNHAWGAAPANIIPRKLMGIEPLEAGYGRMRLHPRPGGLTFAEITIPTIRGSIHETFHSSPAQFTLNVTLPANTKAEVVLPRLGGSDAKVTVDGVSKTGKIEGDSIVLGFIGSGAHKIARSAPKR
ncbi:MAG: alpha-L-rhamnosidase C-terminal domain-containing protein [Capsulimonas sp.]|uniref:alpha-L-rhamnosidase-related protein n=1 Tax=Capsulimonas sp. TaxID=2494211 RepID=UPI003266B1EC